MIHTSFFPKVLCDMSFGKGRTVLQRRLDGSVDFNRNWTDYEEGFGNLTGEYWLGLRYIHMLTATDSLNLLVHLADFGNNTANAEYLAFSVGDSSTQYQLAIGNYSGTAGNSLSIHNQQKFTTADMDNDNNSENCAVTFGGGYWFYNCIASNLNGPYSQTPNVPFGQGIIWSSWRGAFMSLKAVVMSVKSNKCELIKN